MLGDNPGFVRVSTTLLKTKGCHPHNAACYLAFPHTKVCGTLLKGSFATVSNQGMAMGKSALSKN
jgi:hypothetical protein